jgi:hypothetical protein
MIKETLKMILFVLVLATDNAGLINLKKNPKKLKKDLTHMHFLLYDLV